MEIVRLGRTEVNLPIISLGTWSHGGPNHAGGRSVGWTGWDRESQRRSLISAFEAGITHWDTADVYGNGTSEQLIGSVWSEVPRDKVFVATKVGWDPGPYGHFYHPDWVKHQLEASLSNLRVDSIDLYYLHHCNFPSGSIRDDAVGILRDARDAGQIRFIGLSDWKPALVTEHAPAVDPDVVQPYRNVVDDTWESSGLKAWCAKHDVGACFFSTIRHGLLLGKYDGPVAFEDGDFRSNDVWFQDNDRIQRLKGKAQALRERFVGHPEPVLGPLVTCLLDDAPTGTILLGQRNDIQVRSASAAGSRLSPADAAFVRELYADLR